jgi:hypothetical protein
MGLTDREPWQATENMGCGPLKVLKNASHPATPLHGSGALLFVIPPARRAVGVQPTCPGVSWRDLQFRGPFLKMFSAFRIVIDASDHRLL